MNYRYLAEKYAGVSCLIEDRTYEGLIWNGPTAKPSLTIFEAWQKKENELLRQEDHHASVLSGDMEQKQRAARARALEDIVPYEHVVRGKEREAYEEAHKLRREAIECQSMIRVKTEIESAWSEIAKAQDAINHEAQAYLDSTAFVLSWEPSAVPAEIASKRVEAQKRIVLGKMVYQDWIRFRSNELPSQQEIHEAIQKGGEHLQRIRDIAKQAALRYPRPRTY